MIFGLRLTQRCLHEDLRYPDAVDDFVLALEHRIVRDFLHLRRADPEGSEGAIASLRAPFMKLKSGERQRGVTLWDRTPQGRPIQDEWLPYPGVVWLAAVGNRKEGDKHDAYEMFARIGADRLRPVLLDYELLYSDMHETAQQALRDELERAMHELLENAWRQPGRLHEELLVRTVFGDECDLAKLIDQVDPKALAEMGYRPKPRDWVLADLRERRGSNDAHIKSD